MRTYRYDVVGRCLLEKMVPPAILGLSVALMGWHAEEHSSARTRFAILPRLFRRAAAIRRPSEGSMFVESQDKEQMIEGEVRWT